MKKKKIRKVLLVIVIIILVLAATAFIYMQYKINGLSEMTFNEMIAYATEGNAEAVIAVGIVKDGKTDITFYGEDGMILEDKGYEFEIGSITKTFTTSLLCRQIYENKMSLDDSIDMYIDLPEKDYYPTLDKMVTHTSGYKGHYMNKQLRSNILDKEGNDYNGITDAMIIEQLGNANLKNKAYPYKYSNFGMSVVGLAIAENLESDFSTVMKDFIENDLNLPNTYLSDGTGNMDGYWQWDENDAYMPAGAVISTTQDMVQYLQLHMNEDIEYLALGHEKITDVSVSNYMYDKLNINISAMGMGWVIDEKNNIIWHNGGTSNFNTYLGFDSKSGIGVVILSNSSPYYRIPSTVMGARLIMDLQAE